MKVVEEKRTRELRSLKTTRLFLGWLGLAWLGLGLRRWTGGVLLRGPQLELYTVYWLLYRLQSYRDFIQKPKPLDMRLESQKEANGTTPKGIEEDKSQKEAGMAQ